MIRLYLAYKKNVKQRGYLSRLLVSMLILLLPATFFAHAISFSQVKTDITALASDKFKGRANFSKEIDQAANYISQRFSSIGLSTFKNLTTFKQTFAITHIQLKNYTATLNGKKVPEHEIALAVIPQALQWNNTRNFSTHVIAKTDNLAKRLHELNQLGGQHLVMVNKAHRAMFNQYKQLFKKGITTLSPEHQGAIVLVLSNHTRITHINVSAITNHVKKHLSNVIGVLPGTTKAAQNVIFSAHYDHLGTALPELKNTTVNNNTPLEIFNGADDNASGTTAIINLAAYFAKQKPPARTLIFSAFAAEEIGGFGSQYLSQQLDPNNIVAMINIEMIGKASVFGTGTVWMTGMERSNLGELINKNLASRHLKVYEDPYPNQQLFFRSDNATFAYLGVPAHSFSSSQLDKDKHYHKTTDTIDTINLPSMHQVIQSLSVATTDLVNGKITPTRINKLNNNLQRGRFF